MKKLIGYVRVSSDISKNKGNSISNQINKVSDFCNMCFHYVCGNSTQLSILNKPRLTTFQLFQNTDWSLNSTE